MPQALASRARRGSRLQTLGNLAYLRPGRRGDPVSVLGFETVADADAYGENPALPFVLGSGARPDPRLGLAGATLRVDPDRPFPLVVEVVGALAETRPLELLAKVRFHLDALGYVPGKRLGPETPAPAALPATGAVRLSLAKGRDWNQSLHPGLEAALEALARQGGHRGALLTLQQEQPRHRPRLGDVPDGALLASEAMLAAAAGRLVAAGTGPEGFPVVAATGEALLPAGCPRRVLGAPLTGIGLAAGAVAAAARLGATVAGDLEPLRAPDLVRAGGSALDVERLRVAVRRADAVARLAEAAVLDAPRPAPRRPTPGSLLAEVMASLPSLPPDHAAYVSRRLGLARQVSAAVVPGTARSHGVGAEAAAACRALPWADGLAQRLARLTREAPVALDAIAAEGWAEGLGPGGLAFLAGIVLPECHIVDVDRRPCLVPATAREWRDACDAAMAALLANADAPGREALAQAAWDAMTGRPAVLREAVLAGLMPEGPDWRLRMFLDIGGLDHAVREWLRAGGAADEPDDLVRRLTVLRGTPFAAEAVRERLRAVPPLPDAPAAPPAPGRGGPRAAVAGVIAEILSDGRERTYQELHAAVAGRIGRGLTRAVFAHALRDSAQAWGSPGRPTRYGPKA